MRRLGQYEVFDPGMWESSIYDSFDYFYYGNDTPYEEWPSEARYIETYQAQQEALQASVASGDGFFNILKSIIGLATPVVTSILRAEQKPIATALPKASVGVPAQTAGIGGIISSITSSPLLLVSLGIGGFLLLRGRGK